MKLITTFLLVLFCYSNISGQTNNVKNDTVYFKTKLVTPKVDMPKVETEPDSISHNPLNFEVFLKSDSITIKFNNKVFENVSLVELDTFIKKNNIANVSPKKSIVNKSSTTSYDNIKKVIEVFQNNSINHFNLLTQPVD